MLRASAHRVPRLQRLFSTSPRSNAVEHLLKKSPNDVVITLALRTPMTRGKKGGLKDTSADSLLYGMLKAVQERSGVDPAIVEDITTGKSWTVRPTGTNMTNMHGETRCVPLPLASIRGESGRTRCWISATCPCPIHQQTMLVWAHGGPIHFRLHLAR